MVRKHDLGWFIIILLVFLFVCSNIEACETELPEETNIELGFYP